MINSPGLSVWIGYDTRMPVAFAVAKYSLQRFVRHIPVYSLVLDDLRARGLYRRPTEMRSGSEQLWDVISDAPMATDFSISRFLVPHLARAGLAMFCDSDVMFMASVVRAFEAIVPGKAVYCVKHDHRPAEGFKMDRQMQTRYARKNWSSVMIFDCDHPANKKLTVEMVNSLPGRDLHRFCWLEDDQIGDLPRSWNYLVGCDGQPIALPHLVHFTNGLPDMEGHREQEYADMWLSLRPYAVGAL